MYKNVDCVYWKQNKASSAPREQPNAQPQEWISKLYLSQMLDRHLAFKMKALQLHPPTLNTPTALSKRMEMWVGHLHKVLRQAEQRFLIFMYT